MSEWLLTDKEIDIQSAIGREHYCRTHLKNYKEGEKALAGETQVAKAQAKKLMEWLNERVGYSISARGEVVTVDYKDWQALKKEIGLED